MNTRNLSCLIWEFGKRRFDLAHQGIVMGVLNVTPDSFSDGGRHADCEAAIRHGLGMAKAGAAIIDVGGESTRPGAWPVAVEEEIRRTEPVVRGLRAAGVEAAISIDTMKAEVAARALAAGADIVNDVSALRHDPEMTRVMADSGAGLVLMHMQGDPRTMQDAPSYNDVVSEVLDFLRQRMEACLNVDIPPERIALDPGIGFGKNLQHNMALINHLPSLAAMGRPVVLGVSRKSFIGKITGSEHPADRDWPTVALTSYARRLGARVFRVHDPRPNLHALRMTEALLDASGH